jgi:hypothetical protein
MCLLSACERPSVAIDAPVPAPDMRVPLPDFTGCTPSAESHINCNEPLPSIVGTWAVTANMSQRITFSDVGDACLVASVTPDWPAPQPSGQWRVGATRAAWMRRISERTSSSELCVDKATPGQLQIRSDTRVPTPGGHTSSETIEFYARTLVAVP